MLAIVVTFDRLAAGALGCYGRSDGLTPRIDRLAAESVVFDRHFADDLSASPRGHAWWSGRTESVDFGATPHDGPTLFEACRRSGVAVELIADRAALAVVPPPREHAREHVDVSIIDGPDATAQVFEAGRRRIAAIDPEERRLLWLLGSTAGSASATGPATETATDPATETADEDGELAAQWQAVDAAVGSIWADLRERFAGERCLFVLTAARGRPPSVVALRPLPWASLAESQAHVPLIVSDFGRCEPGRCPVLSSATELAPTLLDWYGIPAAALPSGEPSLLTWVSRSPARRPAPREAVCWAREDHGWAIRTDAFLLITLSPSARDTQAAEGQREDQPTGHTDTAQTDTGRTDTGETESHLFAKPDDRWDLHDVAAQEPEAIAALREAAAAAALREAAALECGD